MIQNKSCNATFPQDTPGYNELENSWHALLLSRFSFYKFFFFFFVFFCGWNSILFDLNKISTE